MTDLPTNRAVRARLELGAFEHGETSTRNAIGGFQTMIAESVMTGDIDRARDHAGTVAILRDSIPTQAETIAAVSA